MAFIQRYTAPAANNKFYINTDGGGYNKCIRVQGYSVLPNCVGYAYGRFMEECGRTECNLSTGNAQNWYYHGDGYPRGTTPKQGAVMCWGNGSGKYGHVAIVEEVHDDGSVTASMSNYPVDGKKYPYFDRVVYRPPYTSTTGLPFQGFIYNPYLNATIPAGASDPEYNGHKYAVYRQGKNETFAVLSAGLNQLKPIRQLDADVYVMAKVTGANYFQMKPDQPDPYGTTYGDISAPLNEVWRELPNQDTTLYFDYETGMFGDCTGIHIDQTHNVASPAVVYPKTGNYQFARMVGIGHVNLSSVYTFAVRFTDGTYLIGITKDELTPKQIAADFRTLDDLESIQFFDGGGSAQFGRFNGNKFEYVRDTGREVPSAFAIVSTSPYTPETDEITGETGGNEEQTMNNETTQNPPENVIIYDPEKIDGWTDPEPQTSIISERIAALLSVKSILTLVLTGVFAYLVIKEIAIPEFFSEIYKIVILFFFGYQTGKAQSGGSK